MNLRSVFPLAAMKRLVLVDLPAHGSNQHEINGVADLREFFADGVTRNEPIEWAYFRDGRDPQWGSGTVTFYDARARSAERTGRSEWRLYYSGEFLGSVRPDDVLIIARRTTGELYGLVFEDGSAWLRAGMRLFGLDEIPAGMAPLRDKQLDRELEFAERQLLDELGIEVELPIGGAIETLAADELARVRADGKDFPTTRRMAELARNLAEADIDLPDEALIAWLTNEEALFRAMEAIVVGEKLERGFDSVDDFVDYSLRVQNRRKSRMGFALQNHLEHLFRAVGLRFDTQAITEGKNKPDFLFPGATEYHDPRFDEARLVMLAAKSSCKERWRQILTEAARIRRKHLCTLEQAISADQTREMATQGVILVLPSPLLLSYEQVQRATILTLGEFIEDVRKSTVRGDG